MIVMPVNGPDKTLLVVIIETDNLERMKLADPITLNSVQQGGVVNIRHPHNCEILIAYEEDTSFIMALGKNNDFEGVYKYLIRGFQFKPEIDGDVHIQSLSARA